MTERAVPRRRLSHETPKRRSCRRAARDRARSHGLLSAGRRPAAATAGRSSSTAARRSRSSTRSTTPTGRRFCMCPRTAPPCRRAGERVDRPDRLGPALQAHARPYRAASALGRPALSGHRRLGRRRRGTARFRFGRGRPRQGGGRAPAQRTHRARRDGEPPLDHRRGARGQSGAHQDHVGQAADGNRAACASSRSTASTSSPAAARMSRAPAKSAARR